LRIYETVGYAGLNIGDNDLTLSVEYLKMLQNHSKVPFLSANIIEKKTGKPIFTPYLIKETDGLRIGIIGVLTAEIAPPIGGETEIYSIEDPVEVTSGIINGPLANCDHIIALAHLNPSEIEFFAKMLPNISIIIGGQDCSPILPREINRTIWVQTDGYGLSIGRLNFQFVKGEVGFVDVTRRNLIQQNIDEIQKKIADPRYVKESEGLKGMKEMLIEQSKKIPDGVGKNTYENFLTLLHLGMESDKEIEKLIESSRD
jgi:2',3'-cyclic-nucleotide 2'-phosphodiesterase (5'-nucleotidase family)